eukprot:Opistho-2@13246
MMARRQAPGVLKDIAKPSDGEVVEGLLCSLCMKQARSIADLQQHFATYHKDGANGPSSERGGGHVAEDEDGDAAVTRAHWEPDSSRSVCAERGCGKEFGLMARKTHCRKCGRIYCRDHCVITMKLNVNARPDPAGIPCRVCRVCFDSREGAQQEFGQSRNLMGLFKRTREEKNGRDDVETNKLIIRLEKLLDGGSGGGSTSAEEARGRSASVMSISGVPKGSRREYEKAVVAWKDDSSVRACPECGSSFGLLNRRHHCRLCGGVVCGKEACADMLSLVVARQLLDGDKVNMESASGDKARQQSGLRICATCRARVLRHGKQVRRDKQKPAAYLTLYARLSLARERIESLMPKYAELCERASSTRNAYAAADSREAMSVRQEIMQNFEVVDSASKRIAAIPTQEMARLQEHVEANKQANATKKEKEKEKGGSVSERMDPHELAKQLRRAAVDTRVCQAIRLAATGYMQDVIPRLEVLRPDRQQIDKIDQRQKAEHQQLHQQQQQLQQLQHQQQMENERGKEMKAEEERRRRAAEAEDRQRAERERERARALQQSGASFQRGSVDTSGIGRGGGAGRQQGGEGTQSRGHVRNASSPSGMGASHASQAAVRSPAASRVMSSAQHRGDSFDEDDTTPTTISSPTAPIKKFAASDSLFDNIANSPPPQRRTADGGLARSATVSAGTGHGRGGKSTGAAVHAQVLSEQRQNIVKFITQARREQRWEDVDILSKSLAEIDRELGKL